MQLAGDPRIAAASTSSAPRVQIGTGRWQIPISSSPIATSHAALAGPNTSAMPTTLSSEKTAAASASGSNAWMAKPAKCEASRVARTPAFDLELAQQQQHQGELGNDGELGPADQRARRGRWRSGRPQRRVAQVTGKRGLGVWHVSGGLRLRARCSSSTHALLNDNAKFAIACVA
jgi:hypothetical protein